jgi:hypothetical protein
VLALAFPLLYFRFVSQQSIAYARYLLPIVPFLSLLAAASVVSAVAWMRRAGMAARLRNAVTIGLTVIAIVPPAYGAISYDVDAAKQWTQGLALDWIRREIPAGAGIRLEGSLALRLPPIYRPSYTKQLRLDPPDYYAAHGVQYLVASSQCYGEYFSDPAAYPLERADYQRLFAATEELARFAPTPEHPGPELRILKVTRR